VLYYERNDRTGAEKFPRLIGPNGRTYRWRAETSSRSTATYCLPRILIFSSTSCYNQIKYLGWTNELKTFSVTSVRHISRGCNTVFENRMLLFGAAFYGDVVSEVKTGACRLSKVGTFPVSIGESGCTTLSDETGYYILVCFPYSNQDKWRRFFRWVQTSVRFSGSGSQKVLGKIGVILKLRDVQICSSCFFVNFWK